MQFSKGDFKAADPSHSELCAMPPPLFGYLTRAAVNGGRPKGLWLSATLRRCLSNGERRSCSSNVGAEGVVPIPRALGRRNQADNRNLLEAERLLHVRRGFQCDERFRCDPDHPDDVRNLSNDCSRRGLHSPLTARAVARSYLTGWSRRKHASTQIAGLSRGAA